MKVVAVAAGLLGSIGCANGKLAEYVDTRVGSARSVVPSSSVYGRNTEQLGQTIPAVLAPNGMNFWTPQTRDTELKCVAPYYFHDNKLQGFRNSHWINGGCTQDYGSMTLMPLMGKLRTMPELRASRFSHAEETARPDYYAVNMPDENLRVEMTGTSRAAIFRITYDASGDAWLVVNPNSDEGMGYIEITPERGQIRGYNPVHRIYQGKGESAGFGGWFVVEVNRSPKDWGTFQDSTLYPQRSISKAPGIGAYLKFKVKKGEQLLVKAASSFVDMAGAQRNLSEEINDWDFDEVQKNLSDQWQQRLGQITVNGHNPEKFYGALYRASMLPRAFSDVDGRYPAFGGSGKIMQMPENRVYYDDFSMWDTYRALHPLLNITNPRMSADMMQSLVLKAQQGGWLPIFPCWNSYTAAMIGDHCIAAIADAYVKGIRNFDIGSAYSYMLKNATQSPDTYEEYASGKGRRALESYAKYGYIPAEDMVSEAYHKQEQVSRTLEYAYDDFALSQVARRLGKDADYQLLRERSNNWRNVFDPKTGYVNMRDSEGRFATGGNPFELAKFITEGAPCHYTWYVPHDIPGLIEAMGGRDVFNSRLDTLFSSNRYWHGNEPCHQVAWLYALSGEPQKTQRIVRDIMENEYLNQPGGLSGNDDAGQMSAWYVFAALGFYPVCPGSDEYVLGSPAFYEATIHLENGRKFVIRAKNNSKKNVYVKSIRLNGRPYDRPAIKHSDIINGGLLELEMSPTP